jgi:hypothetical protein
MGQHLETTTSIYDKYAPFLQKLKVNIDLEFLLRKTEMKLNLNIYFMIMWAKLAII